MRALARLLEDSTAGDPSTGLLWTHRSLRKLAEALRRQGKPLSPPTISRLLQQAGFSLRTNRKRLAEVDDPQRDRQFRYLHRLRARFLRHGWPVISIDTKKKELIGRFKNPGRTWRRSAQPVLAHDFRSAAVGRAVPFGIYDLAANEGLVVVGTSRETPTFACNSLRQWWLLVGRERYPQARQWLIEADGGGANDPRKWEWKVGLQRLADEYDLEITVTHYPPGASKWNPIDHRMFSRISANWAGEPLVGYEKMLGYLRGTRSADGFRCRALLDRRTYPAGGKITPTEKAAVNLQAHRILPDWNYTIRPHGPV